MEPPTHSYLPTAQTPVDSTPLSQPRQWVALQPMGTAAQGQVACGRLLAPSGTTPLAPCQKAQAPLEGRVG